MTTSRCFAPVVRLRASEPSIRLMLLTSILSIYLVGFIPADLALSAILHFGFVKHAVLDWV